MAVLEIPCIKAYSEEIHCLGYGNEHVFYKKFFLIHILYEKFENQSEKKSLLLKAKIQI